jgi:broad specificity phosphatase PhoE
LLRLAGKVRAEQEARVSIPELLKTPPPKDVTRVLLLRHGEAEAPLGTIIGNSSRPLSTRGKEQMERAKRIFSGIAFQAVYTSDMRRAVEACKIVLEGRSSALPIELPSLQEQNFGAWQGSTWDQVRSKEPQAIETFFADPVDGKPPGGESMFEVRKRVISWWKPLAPKHKNQTILIVTSIAPIRSFLCEALDLSLARASRLSPGPGQLTILDAGPSFWVAHAMGA